MNHPKSAVTQFNTGSPIKFGQELAPPNMDLAFQQEVFIRIHTQNSSDNWKGTFNVFLGE